MTLPLIWYSWESVTKLVVWRDCVFPHVHMEGKFQTWVPLANAAFTAWDSCPSQAPCGVSSCPGVRTAHALRGLAPRPGPGTACQWRRNSRSFCNNFWNWHAFLNFYPHLPRRCLWKGLWIRWPGKGREVSLLPSVLGLAWLFFADSVRQQVCWPGFDYYTLKSTPWLAVET